MEEALRNNLKVDGSNPHIWGQIYISKKIVFKKAWLDIILQMSTVSIHLTSSWQFPFERSELASVAISILSDWLAFWIFTTSSDALSTKNSSQLLPSTFPPTSTFLSSCELLPVKDALSRMFEHSTESVTPIDSLTWSTQTSISFRQQK